MKGRANNDHEGKAEGSPGDRTGEPPQAEGMEGQTERGPGGVSDGKVNCPECGKEIGKLVLINRMNVKGIGSIPCYDMKLDYRKSSHIGFGRGTICRKCARKFFPDGVAYRVTVDYHGSRITPYIGIKQTGLFATRKEAEDAAKGMNIRSLDNDARYEEIKI